MFKDSDFITLVLTRDEARTIVSLIRSQQFLLKQIPECESVLKKITK
jgi:hypothetical protein